MRLRYTITAEYEIDTTDEQHLRARGLSVPINPDEFADAEEELLGNDPVEFLMATYSYPPTYRVEVVQS